LLKESNKIGCLDRGFVRLIDYMGSDLSVVRSARVSYDAAWRAGENEGSDKKLINYLWRNKHTSPFESVEFQFEVKAPIFVFRQWHRHRTASINELSARYRPLSEEFYIPTMESIGVQSKDNKQARSMVELSQDDRSALVEQQQAYLEACRNSFQTYNNLLKAGWPRELARGVLPMSTFSHMFWKCNLRNLFHFLSLRMHEHSQYEIRVYAKAMLDLIKPIVPACVEAWEQ
jgi:thymidylate synthase (FAD)